jgi:hypothetical protein
LLASSQINLIGKGQHMKKLEIEGNTFFVYEDGSIRIPHSDMHFCLDRRDIAFLYKESKKALFGRKPDIEKIDRPGC